MDIDFHVKTLDEVKMLSIDEFVDYMTEWYKASSEKWPQPTLSESEETFEFPTVEVAKKHLGV